MPAQKLIASSAPDLAGVVEIRSSSVQLQQGFGLASAMVSTSGSGRRAAWPNAGGAAMAAPPAWVRDWTAAATSPRQSAASSRGGAARRPGPSRKSRAGGQCVGMGRGPLIGGDGVLLVGLHRLEDRAIADHVGQHDLAGGQHQLPVALFRGLGAGLGGDFLQRLEMLQMVAAELREAVGDRQHVLGPPSSSSAASQWFWCMVSPAIRKESMSFIPGSLVMLLSRTARMRPVDSAVTFAGMSAAIFPLA